MTQGLRLTVALLLTLSSIACGGSSSTGPSLTATFSPGAAATNNSVTLEEVSSSGSTVTVAVKFNVIAEPFKGATVDITYDAAVISVLSVSQGNLLTGSISFLSTDDGAGSLLISNVDASPSGSTSGTLCTLTFKGIAAGSGAVTLLAASSAIFNGSGDTIPGVTWSGGTVTVN